MKIHLDHRLTKDSSSFLKSSTHGLTIIRMQTRCIEEKGTKKAAVSAYLQRQQRENEDKGKKTITERRGDYICAKRKKKHGKSPVSCCISLQWPTEMIFMLTTKTRGSAVSRWETFNMRATSIRQHLYLTLKIGNYSTHSFCRILMTTDYISPFSSSTVWWTFPKTLSFTFPAAGFCKKIAFNITALPAE